MWVYRNLENGVILEVGPVLEWSVLEVWKFGFHVFFLITHFDIWRSSSESVHTKWSCIHFKLIINRTYLHYCSVFEQIWEYVNVNAPLFCCLICGNTSLSDIGVHIYIHSYIRTKHHKPNYSINQLTHKSQPNKTSYIHFGFLLFAIHLHLISISSYEVWSTSFTCICEITVLLQQQQPTNKLNFV